MDVTSSQLCDDLMRLLNCVKATTVNLAEAQNITKVQVFALYSIDQHGAMSMGHIADMLHCDASNITGIVDRLVTQGLVVREESPQDRRTKNLRLTTKGAQVVADLKQALPQALGCNILSDAERTTLHQIISKICP